jgi:hypothetical protein
MTHLTADELIDAMEGMLPSDRQAHLAACHECRQQLDDLASVLNDAKQVSVPEPSPLFWNQFSRRVNETIGAEPEAAWPQWLRWQVLLPLGATAMIILALALTIPKPEPAEEVGTTSAAMEVPEADHWIALAEIVGDLDIETASEAGVIEPGMAEQAVLQLTAEEQQELGRLLQVELTRAKS